SRPPPGARATWPPVGDLLASLIARVRRIAAAPPLSRLVARLSAQLLPVERPRAPTRARCVIGDRGKPRRAGRIAASIAQGSPEGYEHPDPACSWLMLRGRESTLTS